MNAAALQIDMFAMPVRLVETPAARRTDPRTSHEAAEQHTRSGQRGHQQAQAAAAVKQWPGRTSFELAMDSRLDRYMLARRLPECETAGLVCRGKVIVCTVTGRKALSWWPSVLRAA